MVSKPIEQDKYAVIGNPVAHSKSPQIHAAFAKQTKQNISYEAILAPLDGFEATVRDLIAKGYKGANVTVPFKVEAYEKFTTYTPQPHLTHAVNTLIFTTDTALTKTGAICHNTDGEGLIRDITNNLETVIRGRRVLLLGAGGAAEAVLAYILTEEPKELVIANRSIDKAEKLAIKFHTKGRASSFENLANQSFDIVINATSVGLQDLALPIPNSVFAENCLAYDMVYGRETPFMAQARLAGAIVADGLGMLVEQAAKSFYLWRDVHPDTKPVIEMLRKPSLKVKA